MSGDGGFVMTAQELATAARYRLRVIAMVHNDSSYGAIKNIQDRAHQGRYLDTELNNPDFPRLAAAYGVPGRQASTPEELAAAVREALDRDGPSLIEIPDRWRFLATWPHRCDLTDETSRIRLPGPVMAEQSINPFSGFARRLRWLARPLAIVSIWLITVGFFGTAYIVGTGRRPLRSMEVPVFISAFAVSAIIAAVMALFLGGKKRWAVEAALSIAVLIATPIGAAYAMLWLTPAFGSSPGDDASRLPLIPA